MQPTILWGVFYDMRTTFCVMGLVLVLVAPLFAKMKPLDDSQLRTIKARDGMAFQLKDLRVLNGSDHQLTYRPTETSDNELIFENLNIIETPGNSESPNTLGHDNRRVTTGTFDDPITLRLRSGGADPNTSDEYLELRLPANDESMEPNTIRIAAMKFHDDGYDDFQDFDLGRIEINDADYTGGTKFQVSGKQSGGLRIGLGLKLDGRFQLDTDNGGFALQDVIAANSCVLGDGTPCSQTTSYDVDGDGNNETVVGPESDNEWNFNGALTWADLSEDRPLTVDFIGDCCDASERAIAVEFNPRRLSPGAGQIAVESHWMGGEFFGETYTDELRIVNLRLRGPVSTSSRVDNNSGYSCNGNHSGC